MVKKQKRQKLNNDQNRIKTPLRNKRSFFIFKNICKIDAIKSAKNEQKNSN